MISTKQIRFLLHGVKSLNKGIAKVKRFGRPAEEIGMTFREATHLQKARAASNAALHAGVKSSSAHLDAARAAEERAATFGRGMASHPGLGSYFAKPTLNRMPAAQGASLLRKAKVGGMQVLRAARKRGFTTGSALSSAGKRFAGARAAIRYKPFSSGIKYPPYR